MTVNENTTSEHRRDDTNSQPQLEDVDLEGGGTPSDLDGGKDDTDSRSTELEEKSGRTSSFYIKVFLGLLLVSFVVFVIVDSLTNQYVKDAIEDFLEWVEDNPIAGVFVFVFVYLAATVFFIPGSILTLGAGFVFSMAFGLGPGVLLGSLSVFLGASAGAVVSFLLGRYLLRSQMRRLSQKYTIFKAIDAALETNGRKVFLLLRLSPIIPFNVINYIGGVSSVSFRDYLVALIGILPGTVLYVFLGASAGSLTDSASSGDDATVTIIVVVVGIVFGVIAIWLTTRYAKKELRRVLDEERQGAGVEESSEQATESVESNRSVGQDADLPSSANGDVETTATQEPPAGVDETFA